MFNLLKKEIRLTYLPIVWFFPLLSCMLLIPQYPYCVGVSYCILSIFITFNCASENRDLEYTASLPVPRRDVAKAKVMSAVFIELMQLAVAVVCGCVSSFVLYGENIVGLDANFAFYGLILIGLGIFNSIFFPMYFARGCRTGLSILTATICYALYIVVEETIVGIIPVLHGALDGFSREYLWCRIVVFIVGAIVYAASVCGAYFVSVKKFEKVSL
ncbi:MAG: ABC-2 transporter permease [Christensenellales bacterium]